MKVVIKENYKLENKDFVNGSNLKPFIRDLECLVNIYSNLELITSIYKTDTPEHNRELDFGKFLTISYIQQVIGNNSNSLSKNFTGANKIGLTDEQKQAQNILLEIPEFIEIVNILFPVRVKNSKGPQGSDYNSVRLDLAHSKDNIFELYSKNKQHLYNYFENSLLSTLYTKLTEFFTKISLPHPNILNATNIEDIQSFDSIAEKFDNILRASHKINKFGFAHITATIAEEIANSNNKQRSFEKDCANKVLVQLARESYKQSLKEYEGGYLDYLSNLPYFNDLIIRIRDLAAHTKKITLYVPYIYGGYSYFHYDNEFKHKENIDGIALRNFSKQIIPLQSLNEPDNHDLKPVKTLRKKISKVQVIKTKEESIEDLLNEINSSELKLAVTRELESFSIENKKLENLFNQVYAEILIPYIASKRISANVVSANNFQEILPRACEGDLSIEQKAKLKEIITNPYFNLSKLTAATLKSGVSNEYLNNFLVGIFLDDEIRSPFLKHILANETKIFKNNINLFIILFKASCLSNPNKIISLYKELISFYPKEKVTEFLNQKINFNYKSYNGFDDNSYTGFDHKSYTGFDDNSYIGFTGKIRFLDTSSSKISVAYYRVKEGTILSLLNELEMNEFTTELFELLIDNGADLNATLTVEHSLNPNGVWFTSLESSRTSFNIPSLLLHDLRLTWLEKVIKSKPDFPTNWTNKIIAPDPKNLLVKNVTLLEEVVVNILNETDIEYRKSLLTIGESLYLKLKSQKANSDVKVIKFNLGHYKFAVDNEAYWLRDIILRDAETEVVNKIIHESLGSKEYIVIENILMLGVDSNIDKYKWKIIHYNLAKNCALLRKKIYDKIPEVHAIIHEIHGKEIMNALESKDYKTIEHILRLSNLIENLKKYLLEKSFINYDKLTIKDYEAAKDCPLFRELIEKNAPKTFTDVKSSEVISEQVFDHHPSHTDDKVEIEIAGGIH